MAKAALWAWARTKKAFRIAIIASLCAGGFAGGWYLKTYQVTVEERVGLAYSSGVQHGYITCKHER